MLSVSIRTLNILAAIVWYGGGLVLLLKSGALLREATALHPELFWPTLSLILGLVIGGVKAKYLFSRSCRKNLVRISTLDDPKFWQFFRPQMFSLLALMISAGATLSRLVQDSYLLLCAMATLDLTIAVALLVSSYVFWQQRAFAG